MQHGYGRGDRRFQRNRLGRHGHADLRRLPRSSPSAGTRWRWSLRRSC